ncbi:hypothetical protein [Amycolatopsis kentuckyensis]|uniref:hypothetical protein n=1 Tax=Amycolatopsis kentuckyensis TaxID=218823 RepID=UPI0035681054
MESKDLKALIASAKLPEKTVPLCVRGDLQAEWEDADRQLIAVKSQKSNTLAGNPEETRLAERVKQLEKEMAESTIILRFRALKRTAWLELLAAHPPRKDNAADKSMGINGPAFFAALIPLSLVSPALEPDDLAALLEVITDAQYAQIENTVWALNRNDISVPFSFTASQTIPG